MSNVVMMQTEPTDAETELPLTRFISISVDVAGSTSIKEQLCAFLARHGRDIGVAYQDFAHQLLATERQFIDLLCATKKAAVHNGAECVFEVERLFLIKTIGDEWWYSYSLDGLDDFAVGQHARHLFDALLAFLSKQPASAFLSDTPADHPDGLDEFKEVLRLELPLKITCDLVHGFDLVRGREALISSIVARCCGDIVHVGDDQYMRMMGNLGAIPMIADKTAGKIISVVRSDFVGMEVDRFFRLAGYSQKGRVLVGQQLFEVLDLMDAPAADVTLRDAWKCVSLRNKIPGGGFVTMRSDIFVSLHEYALRNLREPYMGALCTDRCTASGDPVWRSCQDSPTMVAD
ncbi:hypothetical protein [Sulfurisoma sediminicola]|nr:hypothetical protein [Sulfurisoma sediminicola]